MNAIARLLELARTAIAVDDGWPQGLHIVLEPSGLEGRVAFTDEGWVHWAAVDGSFHASRPDALRRMG